MLRREQLTDYQWSRKEMFVTLYHKLHEQLNKTPFVTPTRFTKLTFAEWEMMLDFLKRQGYKVE